MRSIQLPGATPARASRLGLMVIAFLPSMSADPIAIYDRLGMARDWNLGYAQPSEFAAGFWAAPFIVPSRSDYNFAGVDFGAVLNWTPTNVYLFFSLIRSTRS